MSSIELEKNRDKKIFNVLNIFKNNINNNSILFYYFYNIFLLKKINYINNLNQKYNLDFKNITNDHYKKIILITTDGIKNIFLFNSIIKLMENEIFKNNIMNILIPNF